MPSIQLLLFSVSSRDNADRSRVISKYLFQAFLPFLGICVHWLVQKTRFEYCFERFFICRLYVVGNYEYDDDDDGSEDEDDNVNEDKC